MKPRIKVIMGKHIWLVKSKSGYTMPLEEYYQFKSRKGNNFINTVNSLFFFDGGLALPK